MALQKLDTEVRQEQIIQAALDLIAAHGLKRLSLGAVARRVGLVPSAIYRHFKNKEEMLDAVLNLVRLRLFENLNGVCAAAPTALERLERLLMLNIQMVRELQAMPRIVFSEGIYSDYPERKNRFYEILKVYLAKLEEIFRQGQAADQIRQDLDARTLAVVFWGMLPPAVILWHVSDGRFDVTRHAEKVWRIFTEAIRVADKAAPKPWGASGETTQEE